MPPADLERALIVTAHPDDVDFGAGGTIATWVDAGVEVTYCVLTDGDAGGFDPSVPRSQVPAIRRAEQEAAAKVLGVDDVRFLGYPDGRLTVSIGLRRDISRVIRQVRPQRLMCQSPTRSFARIHASHPDHLAAGEASLCAVYPDARNAFAHSELLAEEGLDPWAVSEVWVMTSDEPDRHVDVTETFDRKMAALRSHESQLTDPDAVEERVRTWLGAQAVRAGLPSGHLAETFVVLDTA